MSNNLSPSPIELDQLRLNKLSRLFTIVTITVVILIGLGIGFLISSGSKMSPVGSKIQVVAAENTWGDIASQIGGKYVNVSSIMNNPSLDPHLYESNAKDAQLIANGNIIIENGLGYDDFINKLIASSSKNYQSVLNLGQNLRLKSSSNPHLWYDEKYISASASYMMEAFINAKPSESRYFTENLVKFNKLLLPIDSVITDIRNNYDGTSIAYTERLPEYLIANAQLKNLTSVGFAQAIEGGNDPSPSDTDYMNNLITSHKIKVLIYNSQVSSPAIKNILNLARNNGISLVGMSESLPSNYSSYQQWQLAQDTALLKALR
jgi:zinc/manganese transport system substrate-binding protein